MALSIVDSDVEVIDETCADIDQSSRECSIDARVPCEICGIKIPFNSYIEHVSTHDAALSSSTSPGSSVVVDAGLRKRTREKINLPVVVVDAATPLRKRAHVESSNAVVDDADPLIPCDICGQLVPMADFAEHALRHSTSKAAANSASASATCCEICSTFVAPDDLADHMAAHRVHQELLDADLRKSTSDVDITLQIVEMARNAGSGLPGNRRSVNVGDAVLARWSNGLWYCGHVQSTTADARGFHVKWDPPYASWAPENVAADAVIPRKNHAREVCNFDVALAFVRKLQSFKKDIIQRRRQALEVVYHYTREENVDSIVENNLKVPGESNADGTKVDVKNGSLYGKGIYAATDMHFGKDFGGGLHCAFLCLAIPGVQIANEAKLSAQDDSLQQGQLRVYRTSEQLLPLFFTDMQHAPSLQESVARIANVLESKLLGLVHAGFEIGAKVDVWWTGGGWWKAKVLKANSNGTYDVAWLPPFANWVPQYGVAASCVRLSK